MSEEKQDGIYEEWERIEREIWLDWLDTEGEEEESAENPEPVPVPEPGSDAQS